MSTLTREGRTIAVLSSVVLVAVLAATALAGTALPTATAADHGQGTPGITVSRHHLDRIAAASRTRPRLLGAGTSAGQTGDALPAGLPSKGRYAFLLQLSSRSTSTAYAGALARGRHAARAAAHSQLGAVRTAQDRVIGLLPAKSRLLYRSHAVLAAVAVVTDVRNYRALTHVAGVRAVYPIAPKSPSNSYAVPLQHAPQAWQAHANLGANSTIAIIDTGVDYTHANFGGLGTVAEYQASRAQFGQPATPSAGEFPGDKVVGGFDLAGDLYNADPDSTHTTPAPDPWPHDCDGHGSHVAGTAAGYGENSDGTTYTGPYDTTTAFDSMRIGPGVAPQAKLYAYRVFGCEGSTDLISAAIDKAADPNGDGDISDHVDVVNLSIGSDFDSPQDGDSVATEAASKVRGMTMVVAAGNAGDVYDVAGSPGNAPSAITVAASQDAYSRVDALQVSGPPSIAGDYAAERAVAYDWATQPDLSGTVVALTQPGNTDGCDPISQPVAGHVVLVAWTDDDSARRCDSGPRADNLVAAGASGFIYADDQESFSAGIAGNASIPGVLVAKSAGDAIREQLGAQTVTISGTVANGYAQLLPGNDDTLAGFSSRGIGDAGNLKPDLTAVGGTVFSTANGTGNGGTNDSGTSMATPMVAGAAALVKTAHPAWTPEQVKADLMNTAGADLYTGQGHTGLLYAPQRVGAGRLQVDHALDNQVLAYVTENPGSVSVSFGPQAVTASTTLTKHVRVQNTGLSSRSYDVSYAARTSVPGATYQVTPSTITVGPQSSQTVTVTLHLDPSAMTKTIDPTVATTQSGYARQFQADASGLLVLDSTGSDPQLRVPVYAAPRPASAMSQPASVSLPAGGVRQATLPLTGHGVHQGTGSTLVQSTVAGFELQASSGLAPACDATVTWGCVNFSDERAADLKYVGAASSAPALTASGGSLADTTVYFSITTQGRWRTPAASEEFDVAIDGNGDGVADGYLFSARLPGSDVIVAELYDVAQDAVTDTEVVNDSLGNTDTAMFDSDTIVLQLPVAKIPSWSSSHSRINYAVATFSAGQVDAVDATGGVDADNNLQNPLSFDPLNPGVALYGNLSGGTSPLLYPDNPSSALTLRRDATAYAMDRGLGALVVHFHNTLGHKAQVVALRNTSTTSLSLTPTTVQRGQQVTATITVPPSAGPAASGQVLLKQGATTLASGTVLNGTAHLTFTMRRAGTFAITAQYAGNVTYGPSTSAPRSLSVAKTRPTVGLSLSSSTVRPGRRIRATVRVTTVAGVPATGTVLVRRASGRILARGTLRNGVAVLVWTNASRRSFSMRATYAGDANYLAGASTYHRIRVTGS